MLRLLATLPLVSGLAAVPNENDVEAANGRKRGKQACQADGSCACDASKCPAPVDQCHEAFCTAQGVCDERPKGDGAPCSTGNLCTIDDTCVGGVCTAGRIASA